MSQAADSKPASGSAAAGFGLGCLVNIGILIVAMFFFTRWLLALGLIQLVVIIPLAVYFGWKSKNRTIAGLICAAGLALLLNASGFGKTLYLCSTPRAPQQPTLNRPV